MNLEIRYDGGPISIFYFIEDDVCAQIDLDIKWESIELYEFLIKKGGEVINRFPGSDLCLLDEQTGQRSLDKSIATDSYLAIYVCQKIDERDGITTILDHVSLSIKTDSSRLLKIEKAYLNLIFESEFPTYKNSIWVDRKRICDRYRHAFFDHNGRTYLMEICDRRENTVKLVDWLTVSDNGEGVLNENARLHLLEFLDKYADKMEESDMSGRELAIYLEAAELGVSDGTLKVPIFLQTEEGELYIHWQNIELINKIRG